jgi:hypothetical protein
MRNSKPTGTWSHWNRKANGMETICASDILFVGNDFAKLRNASEALRSPGAQFLAVFHDDLLKLDYAAGRFGIVVICDSVPQLSMATISTVLHDTRPEVPTYVMEGKGSKLVPRCEPGLKHEMNDAEDSSVPYIKEPS